MAFINLVTACKSYYGDAKTQLLLCEHGRSWLYNSVSVSMALSTLGLTALGMINAIDTSPHCIINASYYNNLWYYVNCACACLNRAYNAPSMCDYCYDIVIMFKENVKLSKERKCSNIIAKYCVFHEIA